MEHVACYHVGTTWAPPVGTRQLCSCFGSMSVGVHVCMCIKQWDNLEPAVCNGERQIRNLDAFISKAISSLIKLKRLFTFVSLKVRVCLCVCVMKCDLSPELPEFSWLFSWGHQVSQWDWVEMSAAFDFHCHVLLLLTLSQPFKNIMHEESLGMHGVYVSFVKKIFCEFMNSFNNHICCA